MRRARAVIAALAVAGLLAACGGGSDKDQASERTLSTAATETTTSGAAAAPPAPVTPAAAATAAATIEWTRMEKFIPSDAELPERVSYQAKFDLSNEKAASTAADLQQFQATGRVTGIQYTLSVDTGARTLSVGISYYNNADEPKKLLRNSGDPASMADPNRFAVAGLGDEYIAQRLRLGSGEASAHVVNVAWVRGRYFVSLADLGGAVDTPTDLAVTIAKLVDDKLKANPAP